MSQNDRVQLYPQPGAGKPTSIGCDYKPLSTLSIHSPDYVFTVLVSIFMKPIIISERHPSAINTFTLLYTVRVMEFSASITLAHRHRECYVPVYHARTYAKQRMNVNQATIRTWYASATLPDKKGEFLAAMNVNRLTICTTHVRRP